MTYGDSSLEGAGGYSIGLKFWWHIEFPEEVKLCTLLHRKDNKKGQLVSINVLKFVTVIVNYIASLHVNVIDYMRTIFVCTLSVTICAF